jgi:hypothetical protein
MNTNTRLMNFRVPPTIGSNFSMICRINNTSMTSRIVEFMETYTADKSEQTIRNIQKQQSLGKALSSALESSNLETGAQVPPIQKKRFKTPIRTADKLVRSKSMNDEWRNDL